MATPIIGIDPHKRSHTAVVLDDREEIISHIRIDATARQVDQFLAWAPLDPDRVWAVEDSRGMGRLVPTAGHFAAFNGTAPCAGLRGCPCSTWTRKASRC